MIDSRLSLESETLLMPHGIIDPRGEDLDIAVDNMLLDGQQIHIYRCEKLLGRGGMGAVYTRPQSNAASLLCAQGSVPQAHLA